MSKTFFVTFVTVAVVSLSIVRAQTPPTQAQASASSTQSSIVGAWTLNRDLSDTGQGSAADGQNGGDNAGRQGGGYGGRRRGGGGFGGGRSAVGGCRAHRKVEREGGEYGVDWGD